MGMEVLKMLIRASWPKAKEMAKRYKIIFEISAIAWIGPKMSESSYKEQ